MKEKGTAPYDQAIAILCPRIREILDRIPTQIKAQIQEIRLRSCQPVLLIGLNGTCFISETGRVSYILSPPLYGSAMKRLPNAFTPSAAIRYIVFRRVSAMDILRCRVGIALGFAAPLCVKTGRQRQCMTLPRSICAWRGR